MDQESHKAAIDNLDSLGNIIQDILNKGNGQIIPNLEILERATIELTPTELRELADRIEQENKQTLKLEIFTGAMIEGLVRSPTRLMLGRIAGLIKVIRSLKLQLSEPNVISHRH